MYVQSPGLHCLYAKKLMGAEDKDVNERRSGLGQTRAIVDMEEPKSSRELLAMKREGKRIKEEI